MQCFATSLLLLLQVVFCFVSKDYVYKTSQELSIFEEGAQREQEELAAAGTIRYFFTVLSLVGWCVICCAFMLSELAIFFSFFLQPR
jgi:hypothetical protein